MDKDLIKHCLWSSQQNLRHALLNMDEAVDADNKFEFEEHAEDATYLVGTIEAYEWVLKTDEELLDIMKEVVPCEDEKIVYRSDFRKAILAEVELRRSIFNTKEIVKRNEHTGDDR